MAHEKSDRRVERTRKALKAGLISLMKEMDYDAITIQAIAERANVGRTTFYLHYDSKDDLFLDHHAEILEFLNIGQWSKEELLAQKEAVGLIEFLKLIESSKGFYMTIQNAKDSEQINRRMQLTMVSNLTKSLDDAFPEQTSRLPLPILCNYIVGAQLGLIKWWLMHHHDYSSIQIAHMIQRLQYVAIRDAYQLT